MSCARYMCFKTWYSSLFSFFFFFFQAEDGIRDLTVTGVQTCALPIFHIVPAGDLMPATCQVKAHLEYLLPAPAGMDSQARSEERRVGKECRSRWSPYH